MKPTKLSELIAALEFECDERVTRVDLQNGCVESVARSVLSAAEEGDDESLRALPDWQKPEAEIARTIAADSGERFVPAPTKFDFHEYRHMERFIDTVENPAVADQLWRAIKGKGAFRHFQDTANRLGLLERWWHYRKEAMKKFVIAWAEARGNPYEDDARAP